MRPVHLTVEGLACYRDKQAVDFRRLELFAISGPTGAGKSTLLDAIVFALYGEIPRVKTTHRTEMISAARDRISVMLDFEVGESLYRITRVLRRNGVQSVRLEEMGDDGAIKSLADKVLTANDQVVTILGLEASAFLQAVILPQGEFARFLKAQPRDRRSMLRTLLRLDVYERMRERAQRLAASRKSTVETLQKVLADEYAGVDEAAVAELELKHARIIETLDASRRLRDETQATLVRLRGLHAKTRELRQLDDRRAALREQAAEMSGLQARLEAAARAVPVLPFLQEAARAITSAAAAARSAEEARERHEAAKKDWTQKAAALKSAEKAAKAIQKMRGEVARLHQVLGRLPEREQLRMTLERQAQSLEALEGERAALAAAVESAKAEQARQQAVFEEARQAAEASGHDPELDALLESVRDLAVVLGSARRGAATHTADIERKRREVDGQAQEIGRLTKEAETARKSAEKAQRHLETAEEALHRAVHLNEANHLREGLAPGEPCPVCEQLVETAPPVRRAPEVEKARAALQAARETWKDADALARQKDAALSGEQAKLQAAQKSLADLESLGAELRTGLDAGEERIRQMLGDRSPKDEAVVEAWVEAQVAAQARSRKAGESAKARLATAERALERARSQEATARERLGEREEAKARLEEERSASRQRLTVVEDEIRAVAASDDPAAEAEALEEQIRQLEAGHKTAAEEAATAENQRTAAQEVHRLQAEAAEAARQEADRRAESRDAEISRSGFDGEVAVREALLDEPTTARLKEQVQRHGQESHVAEERAAALRAELGEERVSDEELAKADQLAAEMTGQLETALGEAKRLEEQVRRMKERLQRAKDLRAQLDNEETAQRLYDLLAGDLRSDKFQAYVLHEVFHELVRGASARLMTLTGERYSLQFRDDEIRVVDHDNADETRISDTLSGGETFLTSLALALELSNQVQRAVGAVHLDSLFIDEGFGTLDPDTLALVSETLQSLRVGGRMIGVITHIPELRDEFAQQILVTKHQGYSTVEVRGVGEGA